jgi:ABC-2 type transport system permease protein
MAVYERIWRRYQGGLTPLRWRASVITRYALHEAFSSRIFTAFYVLCLLPTLVAILAVYLSSNTELLASVQGLEGFVKGLTAVFVKFLFIWQAVPAYLLAVIVGPALISADLQNNALSLYLSRPITRAEYLYGKMGVLFLVLAPITWISGLTVTLLCALLDVEIPGMSNTRLALAYMVGHLIWFLVVSLLTLAVSAWVRFKPAARGALLGIIFILAGFSQAINAVTGTSIGDLVFLTRAIGNVALWILELPLQGELPIAASFFTLGATCVLSVWMLYLKLRAHEVVK